MATRNHKTRRDDEGDTFYEAMPYAPTGDFGWTEAAEEEAPDHDFAAIDDDGRAIAIRTLVFVAVATVLLCLLLLWGIQMAQQMLPTAAVVPGRP
jgi:hypothetical protein